MKVTAKDHADAIGQLTKLYPVGATVCTIVESVSRSGMGARIRVVSCETRGEGTATRLLFLHPNWAIHAATGIRLNRGGYRDTLQVNGCGFDRARSIVDAIESALGYKAGALNHEAL